MNSQYALPTKQINPIGPHDHRIGHAQRGNHPYNRRIRPEHEVAPVTEIVTTISESIRTDSRNRPKKKSTPSVPKLLGTPPQHRPYRAIGRVFAALRRRRVQISSIAPLPGANFKHRAASGRVFAASRCRRAQISSIAPPPGANFKHRAAIGRLFAALRRQRAQISSITPPPGANFKHRAAIGRVLTALRRRRALLH